MSSLSGEGGRGLTCGRDVTAISITMIDLMTAPMMIAKLVTIIVTGLQWVSVVGKSTLGGIEVLVGAGVAGTLQIGSSAEQSD